MNVKLIKKNLKEYGELSLSELSQVCNVRKENLEPTLKEWVQKNRILVGEREQFCSSGCSCSSEKMNSCSSAPDLIYKWAC